MQLTFLKFGGTLQFFKLQLPPPPKKKTPKKCKLHVVRSQKKQCRLRGWGFGWIWYVCVVETNVQNNTNETAP